MPDSFEKEHGLLVNSDSDVNLDPDGDRLTNIEEYWAGGDPNDPNSPERTYFVSLQGRDSAGQDGSSRSPWLSIPYALSRMGNDPNPRRLVLGAGTFSSSFSMKSKLTVVGQGKKLTKITGAILVAEDSVLQDFTVVSKGTIPANVTVRDARARLTRIAFEGLNTPPTAIGLQIEGDEVDDSIIEGCDFDKLLTAVFVDGELPVIRQSKFTNLGKHAIDFSSTRTLGKNTLGSVTDAFSGWNSFDVSSISDSLVKNTRIGKLKMENNFWNIPVLGDLDGRLFGDNDFEPTGDPIYYSITPGGIACTVLDSDTNARITNATLTIIPSTYAPITNNANGVYLVPALVPGNYTVQIVAPAYESGVNQVNVQQAQIRAVVSPLVADIPPHSADVNQDNQIGLSELLRIIQFYNAGALQCQGGTEDGFAPFAGATNCLRHASDYNPNDWSISLSELLRAIQLFNGGSLTICGYGASEDGYCLGGV